jgi:ABC-type dipeptide/oligopeptide/nickel transport system permease subunit
MVEILPVICIVLLAIVALVIFYLVKYARVVRQVCFSCSPIRFFSLLP